MCTCRPSKKSFFIDDILSDVKIKSYKTLRHEAAEPFYCANENQDIADKQEGRRDAIVTNSNNDDEKFNKEEAAVESKDCGGFKANSNTEIAIDSVDDGVNYHEQRRNTFPFYPTALKASLPWPPYRLKDYPMEGRQSFSYYSDPVINSDQILKHQLAANRFTAQPYPTTPHYGYDRISPGWCHPWWAAGGRRKGGQVRFSAAQTGSLERRFTANKYLSPDERRGLAATLRLSDRQVKTWFQNRRAKWRRTVPDSADAGSPASSDELSEDDVQVTD